MKLKDYTQEEINAMSYDDVAFMILTEAKKKMKINELFQQVAKVFNLSDDDFVAQIGDFFELLSTDQRFIMLEDGYWDLKDKYSAKIVIDEEEDEELLSEEIEEDNEEEIEPEEDEIFYNEEETDDNDDNLQDLVVINEPEDEANIGM